MEIALGNQINKAHMLSIQKEYELNSEITKNEIKITNYSDRIYEMSLDDEDIEKLEFVKLGKIPIPRHLHKYVAMSEKKVNIKPQEWNLRIKQKENQIFEKWSEKCQL